MDTTLVDFQSFLSANFQGYPVEACWNIIDDVGKKKKKNPVNFRKLSYLCLRPFTSGAITTDLFMMKVPNRGNSPTRTKIIKEFYDYLTGKSSPFKAVLSHFASVGKDGDLPDAFIWLDPKKGDTKLAVSLLTAMRLHTCWGTDVIWHRLTETGFTPEEALLLANLFNWAGQTLTISNGSPHKFDAKPENNLKLNLFGGSKTDMPFSACYNPSGFGPLFAKQPKLEGEGQKPQPCNYIWHADGKVINADSLNTSSPEYKNATIKVTGKDTYGLVAGLTGKGKISSDCIAEIQHRLHKNLVLEL